MKKGAITGFAIISERPLSESGDGPLTESQKIPIFCSFNGVRAMKPVFWKLSMGGVDFGTVLDVFDWLRQDLVLVHKDTAKNQGKNFVEQARLGDYFYLCHGNKNNKKQKQGVLLLGQFTTPANLLSARGNGWAERRFHWIKTSISTKPFKGKQKGWTPNYDSTFFMVPEEDIPLFESVLLAPYFDLKLADFRIEI